jgi:ribosomal protein L2
MSEEEKKFKELCEYVKKEIMGYDENQKLSKHMCLRLRGMKDGKFIANKTTPSMAHYSYDIILLTFKYIKHHGLDNLLIGKKFNSEEHKFNYIMVIISNNINTVYNKVKKIREEQNRSDNIKVVELPNYKNKYESTPKKVNKDLEKFW